MDSQYVGGFKPVRRRRWLDNTAPVGEPARHATSSFNAAAAAGAHTSMSSVGRLGGVATWRSAAAAATRAGDVKQSILAEYVTHARVRTLCVV